MYPYSVYRCALEYPYEEKITPELILRLDKTKIAGDAYETFQFNDGPVWLAQNLRYDEEGDRTIRLYRRGGSDVSHPDPVYARAYGRYYTFETAREIARESGEGFCLPSRQDWEDLLTTLRELYRTASAHGPVRDFYLKNPRGRRLALHWGGCRWSEGQDYWARWQGVYWSATTVGSQRAWCYSFSNTRKGVYRFQGYQRSSFSVRLVRSG